MFREKFLNVKYWKNITRQNGKNRMKYILDNFNYYLINKIILCNFYILFIPFFSMYFQISFEIFVIFINNFSTKFNVCFNFEDFSLLLLIIFLVRIILL